MGVPTDDVLVAGLRTGDEEVFACLLNGWSGSMLRLARSFVLTTASAEEVVQDTWLAVFEGIERFEGRSSLRTWAPGDLHGQPAGPAAPGESRRPRPPRALLHDSRS